MSTREVMMPRSYSGNCNLKKLSESGLSQVRGWVLFARQRGTLGQRVGWYPVNPQIQPILIQTGEVWIKW